jgi:hypothetical protein
MAGGHRTGLHVLFSATSPCRACLSTAKGPERHKRKSTFTLNKYGIGSGQGRDFERTEEAVENI